jgi:hypothetical protein
MRSAPQYRGGRVDASGANVASALANVAGVPPGISGSYNRRISRRVPDGIFHLVRPLLGGCRFASNRLPEGR